MENTEQPELKINSESVYNLIETKKWTMFLAIAGFIFLGLMVVFLIIGMTSLSSFAPSPMPILSYIIILVMIGIYFFPLYYLYQYSTLSKEALAQNNSHLLAEALGYLKSHFKFIGILMIVILSFYALIFIIGLISGNLFNAF